MKNFFKDNTPVCMYGVPQEQWEPERKYDTVVFDLGGVLMQHGMQRCIDAFLNLMGEENMQNYLGLGSDGEGAEESLMMRFEQGLVSAEDFVTDILGHCKQGTSREQVVDAWLLMHAGIPQDRLAYVLSLRQNGYRTCLLSNNNELHWNDVCQNYPIYDCFDDVFLSHEMHISKPDPRIFIEIAKVIESNPERTIFVDDIATNRIAATEAVGWKTCGSVDELKNILS